MTVLSRRLRLAADVLMRGEAGLRPEPDFEVFCSWYQQAGRRIHDSGVFVGCPLDLFELTSRDPLCVALMEGLKPGASVLEVGCGCLRSGYWFIRFLDPGRYCGIEPNETMLAAGRQVLLGSLAGEKRPRFSTSDRFDFGEFGERFDFVIAFSIWSHASKAQIGTMLDAFVRTANPGAKFVTSWVPARPGAADYQGDAWVGRSHRSDEAGIVAHDEDWLREAATARGLELKRFDHFLTIGQSWLVITRP